MILTLMIFFFVLALIFFFIPENTDKFFSRNFKLVILFTLLGIFTGFSIPIADEVFNVNLEKELREIAFSAWD